MWVSIIGALLPSLIRWLAPMILQDPRIAEKRKKELLEWIQKAGDDMNSVMLHKYGEKQLLELKDKPFVESP